MQTTTTDTSTGCCIIAREKNVEELRHAESTNKTNCSLAFLMLQPAQRNVATNSDEQHAIFANELQS
jgi:hypothetical protein